MACERVRVTLGVVGLIMISAMARAGYYEGFEAYVRGDYELARDEWEKVAKPDGPGMDLSDLTSNERAEMADAQYALGLLYWNGRGVAVDFPRSAEWLQQAAEMGHAEAQLKLGYMYINGKGMPQNYPLAKKWLKASAEQGNMDAQYNLAVLYYKGLGGAQSLPEARHWFELAAKQGDKVSERVLADIDKRYGADGKPLVAPVSAAPTTAIFSPASAASPAPTAKPSATSASRSSGAGGGLQAPASLAARGDNRFVLQLMATANRSALDKTVAANAAHGPFAWFSKVKNGQTLYVLVQGDYASSTQAKAAIAGFPVDLKANSPYPISIGAIRKHLN